MRRLSPCLNFRLSRAYSFASRMARRPPSLPLVAVMGTTGTGKSDLAVDLAVRFNGEIINADAMQMYKGLPIITNQISEAEQRSVPHHLLAAIDHDEPTWTVSCFARGARRIIHEIRSRGKLPIVVGGTHYYINSLLFDDTIVRAAEAEENQKELRSEEETSSEFPILNEPTAAMFKKLQQVDPSMAARWHPDDRRKIRRSLEIYLTTGKRASEIYAQQQAERLASDAASASWESLMFWVYSKPEVLNKRLNKRINKMADRGLMDEVRELDAYISEREANGKVVDRTRGIWQSIGFKQMEPLLEAEKRKAEEAELKRAREAGLELMRIATRQYARSQIKWLRGKTGPELRQKDALRYLFVLDSSDVDRFSQNVLDPAAEVLRLFLAGETLPQPQDLSDTAKDVLQPFMETKAAVKTEIKTFRCDDCHLTLVTEAQWQDHITGRRHQRVMKNKKRRALVSLPDEADSTVNGNVSSENFEGQDELSANFRPALHTSNTKGHV